MAEKDLKKENKTTETEKEKQPLNEESMDKVSGGKIILTSQKELKEEDGDKSARAGRGFCG